LSRVVQSRAAKQQLSTTTGLTIGKINFLNTKPFFHGLEQTDYQLIEGVPSQINQALASGQLDIGVGSSLAYAQNPDQYLVLPGVCIASRGKSRSVLLVSHLPANELAGKRVALTTKSLSAASLLKILFCEYWDVAPEYIVTDLTAEQVLSEYDAALVIGDEALYFDASPHFAYDVSEVWQAWTGLPFCFALWTVQRSVAESHPRAVNAFRRQLVETVELNLKQPKALFKDNTDLSTAQKAIAVAYVESLEYRLDEDVLHGTKHFFERAARLGLIDSAPKLHFFGS